MATTAQSIAPMDSRQKHSGWFVSPRIDIWFVLGVGAMLSILLFVATRHRSLFLIAAVLFAVLSDYPHVLQTTTRIWLDPRERARYGRHYAVSFVIVGVTVAALMLSHLLTLLVAIWAYWQVMHVLKQHYGILNIYAGKSGYKGPRKLAKYLLFAACLAPFVYRAAHGLHFSEYVVFGYRLPFSNLSVPTPPIPAAVVVACYLLVAVLLVMFIREQRSLKRAGSKMLPGMALATMASAIICYNLSYLFVRDLFALILIATTTHSLQYHLISWTRNKTRFEFSPVPAEHRLILARVSQRRTLPIYVGGLVGLGILTGQLDKVLLGFIPLTLVLHHFYLDGVIWKGKDNPELAYDLGIVPPRLTADVTSTG